MQALAAEAAAATAGLVLDRHCAAGVRRRGRHCVRCCHRASRRACRPRTRLKRQTLDMAIPTVTVIHPKARRGGRKRSCLPGNAQAYVATPIYARTNGYLKTWYFDIGAHVKAGQLLAEIETPEVDRQLDQARADLATAQANYDLSQTTADALSVAVQKRFGGQAGCGRPRGRSACQEGHGRFGQLSTCGGWKRCSTFKRFTRRSTA